MSSHHTLQLPPRMVGFVWNMLARVCEGHHDTALHWHDSVHLDIMHVATLEIIVCFHTLETGCNCTNHCCHLHGCEKLLTWWCIVDAMWQKSSLKQKIQAVVVIHLSKPISHFTLYGLICIVVCAGKVCMQLTALIELCTWKLTDLIDDLSIRSSCHSI